MKNLFLLAMLSITLIACDRQDRPNHPPRSEQDVDNTGRNVRDRDSAAITTMDQSETELDRTITQKIRQAIMSDNSLSTNAKNIKIVTINGIVTLRGPVASPQEKDAIVKKVNEVKEGLKVDNQLEVIRDKF